MKAISYCRLIVFCCIAQLLNSCHIGHTYVNNVPNIHTFDSSYFKASGYIGMGHLETQLTVPINSWFGLQTNGFISRRGKFGEFGTGFRVSPAKHKHQLYLYSGVGLGDLSSNFEYESLELVYDYDMKYKRFYVMPVFNYIISDKYQLYSGIRISLTQYYQYNFTCIDKDSHSGYNRTDTLANIHLDNISGTVIDPFIGYRYFPTKRKNLIIEMQLFYSYKYFEDLQIYKTSEYKYSWNSPQHPLSQSFSINIGVTYNLRTTRR